MSPPEGQEKAKIVLFCGLANAGKTTILNIFSKGDVFKTAPTLGVSLSSFLVKDTKFRIFDLGGQKRFREEITNLLPFADMVIFVVDAADQGSFPEVEKEFKRVLSKTNRKLVPICVLRHKSDLSNIFSVEEISNKLGLDRILDRRWAIFSTSAVTLDGLIELVKWIYEQFVGEKFEIPVDSKKDEEISFHYPCPMLKESDEGETFCLNQDEFIETQLTCFGFQDEVNKMVLKVLPDLRKESLEETGKDICPDFCILNDGEQILRCPVTHKQIMTRGTKVSLKRYEDAVVLAKIYGAKVGDEICRECIYKIIISPDTILSEKDVKELMKTSKLLGHDDSS